MHKHNSFPPFRRFTIFAHSPSEMMSRLACGKVRALPFYSLHPGCVAVVASFGGVCCLRMASSTTPNGSHSLLSSYHVSPYNYYVHASTESTLAPTARTKCLFLSLRFFCNFLSYHLQQSGFPSNHRLAFLYRYHLPFTILLCVLKWK